MTIVRGMLFVVAALMLPLGLLATLGGEYRLGMSGLLVGGAALLMATWAWGYPTAFPAREWVCIALFAAGMAVLGAWIPAIVIVLVIFLLNVAGGRLVLRRMSAAEFEAVGPEAVMPKAEPLVAEFEAEGYRRVGGYRWRIPIYRKLVTAAVLAAPEDDRFAIVADRVWEVVSRFGDRWLTTTSSGLAPNTPGVLRQKISRARPAELVRAHRSALELLAGRELQADRLAEAEVVDAALALENSAIEAMSEVPTKKVASIETRRTSEDPVLGDDERSGRRIDAWLEPQTEG